MNDTLLNNALNKVQTGATILFVWSGEHEPASFQATIERFQERAGPEHKICVENASKLATAVYSHATFDCLLANVLTHAQASYDSKLVELFLKLLKPRGQLIAFASANSSLSDELKLNGFLNVLSDTNEGVCSLFAEKANFEVGSSSKLKFGGKPGTFSRNNLLNTNSNRKNEVEMS